MNENIIVVIGGPGVGKTSVINKLKELGYDVVHEAAREIIEEGIAVGKTIEEIRADDMEFQRAIFNRKIERELAIDTDAPIFFDRGLHDTKAYLQLARLEMDSDMHEALKKHVYKYVFLLDMLPEYDASDPARTESFEEAARLHETIANAYEHYGMQLIKVPAYSVQERVNFILSRIEQNIAD